MANEEKPVRGPGRKVVKKGKGDVKAPAPVSLAAAAGIALEGDKSPAEATAPGFESGGFVMAMAYVLHGKTVRRRSWVGAKSVSKDHPSGRVILENADIVANDWEVV